MTYANGSRRATNRLLWALVVLVVFGIGFGPVWVSSQNAKADLAITCDIARANIEQLRALRISLEADSLIASDLGLPIAADLERYVETFTIPEVPPECDAP